MAYFLNLFSPETYARFSESDRSISGFRARHRNAVTKVRRGDILVCYLTRLSRWVGLLRIEGEPFVDSTPRFVEHDDPFIERFEVKPLVWLPAELAIPIHDDSLWSKLSMTCHHPKSSAKWTGFFRTSLNQLTPEDGLLLEALLTQQGQRPNLFTLSEQDKKHLSVPVVRRPEGSVTVTVPEDAEPSGDETPRRTERESIKMQAMLTQLGATMGFRVWLPASDRAAVMREWNERPETIVDVLPLNYDTATLDTIERIDVLWLKGRSIVRAFEIEHTTAIYSGILRMADLLSLQPNMDIKLHIVAPESRRTKVFDEIRRPVFSLLERRPLSKTCTFLSYDSIREIAELPHLAHVSDTILDEYADPAE